MTAKWRDIAGRLAAEIISGERPAGSTLPHIRDLVAEGAGAKATVHRAYQQLEADGYVKSVRGRGTVVRDRSRVRVPFSVYGEVLTPDGNRGPWETATAAQGLDGRMVVRPPEQVDAPEDIAEVLSIEPGTPAIRRRRRAMIGDEVVQIQDAWYPLDVAHAAGLDAPGKITGGVLGAMTGAGLTPSETDHRVTAWVPTPEQAAELSLGARVPVLVVERITRDTAGQVLEVVRVTGAADRLELVYEGLPLKQARRRKGST